MWEAIRYVSSGITLIAFIVAAVLWAHRYNLLGTERRIKLAPESERAALIDRTLESFRIDPQSLAQKDRYALAVKQLDLRAEQFRLIVFGVVTLSVIAALLAIFAPGGSQQGDGDSPKQVVHAVAGDSTNPLIAECQAALSWTAAYEALNLSGSHATADPAPRVLCERAFFVDSSAAINGLLARALVVEGRRTEALGRFEAAAAQGDSYSALVLGHFYLRTVEEWPRGIEYLRRAVDLGNADAPVEIGLVYEIGYLEMPDYRQAAAFYQMGVERGSAEAHYRLGQLFQFGLGVQADIGRARSLYVAAGTRHEDAVAALATLQ